MLKVYLGHPVDGGNPMSLSTVMWFWVYNLCSAIFSLNYLISSALLHVLSSSPILGAMLHLHLVHHPISRPLVVKLMEPIWMMGKVIWIQFFEPPGKNMWATHCHLILFLEILKWCSGFCFDWLIWFILPPTFAFIESELLYFFSFFWIGGWKLINQYFKTFNTFIVVMQIIMFPWTDW